MKQLSKPDIIRLAACHTCCAKRGEPCTFARVDDPHGARAWAGQSHTDRIMRARRIAVQEEITIKELALELRL